MFGRLRRRLKKSARIYYIEINDLKIDEDISHIIIHIEKKIKQFKSNIEHLSIHEKDKKLEQFYEEFIGLKQRIEKLKTDVSLIRQVEQGNMEYFIIKDHSFLADKQVQLDRISNEINGLLQVAEQKPTKEELKEEFLPEIIKQLDNMIEATKHIIDDDHHLRLAYKQFYHM